MLRSLNQEAYQSDSGAHNDHGVEAYEAPFEKVAGGESVTPAVVVGIADHETREHEEKVDGEIAVIDVADHRQASGEGKTLVDMIPQDEQCGHTSEAVEKLVMRFGVGISARCRGVGSDHIYLCFDITKVMKNYQSRATDTYISPTDI